MRELKTGDYARQIYRRIDECTTMILILPPKALDDCWDEKHWVRLEIARALRKKKTIIPLMLPGFSWPAQLPDDIKKVELCQGILVPHMSNYTGMYEKLKGMLGEVPTHVVQVVKETPQKERKIAEAEERPTLEDLTADQNAFACLLGLGVLLWMGAMTFIAFMIRPHFAAFVGGDWLFTRVTNWMAGHSIVEAWFLWAILTIVATVISVIAICQINKVKFLKSRKISALREEDKAKEDGDVFITLPALSSLTMDACQEALNKSKDPYILEPIQTEGTEMSYGVTLNTGRVTLYARDEQSPIQRLHHRFFIKKHSVNKEILYLYAGCESKNAIAILLNQGLHYVRKVGNLHQFRSSEHIVTLRLGFGVVQELEIVEGSSLNTPLMTAKPGRIKVFFADLMRGNLPISIIVAIGLVVLQILTAMLFMLIALV